MFFDVWFVCTFGIFKLFFDYHTEQMIDKIDKCAL